MRVRVVVVALLVSLLVYVPGLLHAQDMQRLPSIKDQPYGAPRQKTQEQPAKTTGVLTDRYHYGNDASVSSCDGDTRLCGSRDFANRIQGKLRLSKAARLRMAAPLNQPGRLHTDVPRTSNNDMIID
jgi:hypothetical protein